MRIADILRQKGSHVFTIEPHRTVSDAIKTLNKHNIGALVVVAPDGRLSGIITERDILHEAGARCERLKDTPVGDVMTKDIIIGVPDDHIDYVRVVMTKNRIRHLPILEGEELVGIISIGDVVNANLDQTQFENRLLKDYIQGVTH
jgi:CBS domain-containing protein